jgi:hypothetical protein
MNLRLRILAIVCLAAFLLELPPTAVLAAEAGDVLDEIRAAMAERDLPLAKAKLEEAAKRGSDAAFGEELARLQLLHEYLDDFWKSVDEGARSLQAVDELLIGEIRTAVVEYQPGLLVLRVQGQNRRYTVKTLPAKVALTLAERVLKPDAPRNKVYFGTFLLMDGKGDRELARKLWNEAQQANVDVSALLPELAGAAVASLPMEIPPVASVMRKLLAPASWSLRRQVDDRIVREPLKDSAEQTAAGHLQVAVAGDASDAQLVYNRKIAANFVCRVILQNLGDGQVFGLLAADSLDAAHQVPLPRGSVMIELVRQGGAFQCRLNQKEISVETRGDAAPNIIGMIGVTMPSGSKCRIAWFELQTR